MRHVAGIYESLFDMVADTYDSPGVEFFRPVGRKLINLTRLQQGERVLDIGCGRGAVLLPAAEAVGPLGAAIGIDLSIAMITVIKAESARNGYYQMRGIQMDGQSPGFSQSTFDAIVSSMSIHMLDDISCAYANYARILKRRGTLAGCILANDEKPEPRIFGLKSIARMAETYTGSRAKNIYTGDFNSAENIRDGLLNGGFINVRILDDAAILEADNSEKLISWTWSHGMRLLWQRVPEAEHTHWVEEIKAETSEYIDKTGTIKISVPVWYFIAQKPLNETIGMKAGRDALPCAIHHGEAMTTKRVLVTGGGGFIGRNMIHGMLAGGYTITALDNYRIGGKEFLANDVRENVEWIEGDVRDYELVDRAVRGKDAVIHLAAPSSFLMYEEAPIEGTILTTNGFLNVLESMKCNDIKKLVYASTSAVYEGNPVPYVEGMPLNPPDLKALSKKWNEEAADQYSQRYGINAIGLRPFSVYGPDEFSKHGYSNVISLFTWAALGGATPVVWGDGRQTRDFIHVRDVGRAFQLALETDLETTKLNVGTGIETTFAEVIQTIGRQLDMTFEPKYVPVPIAVYAQRLLADTARARNVLRFSHEIGVEDGIADVIEAARSSQAHWPHLARMQMYFEGLPKLAYRPG